MTSKGGYSFVGRRAEGRTTLLSQRLADGGRVVLVFSEKDAADAFRIVEGLGEEWEVLEYRPEGIAAQGIAALLGSCAAAGVKYTCLDPPTALTRKA